MPRQRAIRFPYPDDMYFRIEADIEGMSFPVRCNCGSVYDMGKVEVTARYADCSMWITPCCHRQEDDRPWTRKYTELSRNV